jgi:hypothetical protein
VDDVVEATGFELVLPPDGVPVSRPPSDEELAVLDRLDPTGARLGEVRE